MHPTQAFLYTFIAVVMHFCKNIAVHLHSSTIFSDIIRNKLIFLKVKRKILDIMRNNDLVLRCKF